MPADGLLRGDWIIRVLTSSMDRLSTDEFPAEQLQEWGLAGGSGSLARGWGFLQRVYVVPGPFLFPLLSASWMP
jgi:hypothetical protein